MSSKRHQALQNPELTNQLGDRPRNAASQVVTVSTKTKKKNIRIHRHNTKINMSTTWNQGPKNS